MKAYLVAPMRGVELNNFPAIDRAADTLRSWSYKVWSPADHDRDNGFDEHNTPQGEDLASTMQWCVSKAAKADAVIVLEGWEKSAGAKVELTVARACGKDVYRYVDDYFYPYLELVSDDELAAVLDGPDVGKVKSEAYDRGYELGMSHGKALHNPGCHAKSYEVGYADGGKDTKNRTVVAFNTIVDAINAAGDTLGFAVEDAADDFPLV